MKKTSKCAIMGVILGLSGAISAQTPIPAPQLKPDRVPAVCGEFKALMGFMMQPGSPYRELLAYADKEKTHRTYVLIDPSDGEVLHIVEYPEGKGCIVSQGDLVRVSGKLFRGI